MPKKPNKRRAKTEINNMQKAPATRNIFQVTRGRKRKPPHIKFQPPEEKRKNPTGKSTLGLKTETRNVFRYSPTPVCHLWSPTQPTMRSHMPKLMKAIQPRSTRRTQKPHDSSTPTQNVHKSEEDVLS
mmetsp:Transcript_22874/g.45061  ORF Transcript_22874/g.45061 Transcript_22874/m.45061 type:complete len:128 (-) Transcript_22874:662-1045(-)